MTTFSWKLFAFYGDKRYLADCGHLTALKGRIQAFGCERIIEMPENLLRTPNYCISCLEAMTIQCGWCGRPIFLGDPVTLYSGVDCVGRHHSPWLIDSLTLTRPDSIVVGCLRPTCADTIADRAGFWTPGMDGKGRVQRIPTVYEMIIRNNAEAAMITDAYSPEVALRF